MKSSMVQGHAFPGPRVFPLELRHIVRSGLDLVDVTHALTTAPDVLPGVGLVAAKVCLARIALRQVGGVQPCSTDAGRQVVAVYAGKYVHGRPF